jgi:hypothetical protein
MRIIDAIYIILFSIIMLMIWMLGIGIADELDGMENRIVMNHNYTCMADN